MRQNYFFYDLETTGLDSRDDRIMQFAGQRTDLDLNPIGEPVNLLVKLNDDTLPSPYAIKVTGITPQQTQTDGLTEAEFCKYLSQEIFTPGTIATGYNSVRFDDEFMRHLFWRNFYDPYAWQWQDGRSKWDLLDVVRMTRALRPEGINWPIDAKGKATNRLELITKLNGISHEAAHDALSDVNALIDIARLIREKQPQLYDFLLKMRDKKAVQQLVNLEHPKPFVYSSGRYAADFQKTTVAYPIAPAQNGNVLVYDLRQNPDSLVKAENYFPTVKVLKYNQCPAVAPLGVLEQGNAWQKIELNKEDVQKSLQKLVKNHALIEQIRTKFEEKPDYPPAIDPEAALYDDFLDNPDRTRCDAVRSAMLNDLADFQPEFSDPRLPELLVHYKARNFPDALSAWEHQDWENYRAKRIARQSVKFLKELEEINQKNQKPFLVQELNLWFQSVQPY